MNVASPQRSALRPLFYVMAAACGLTLLLALIGGFDAAVRNGAMLALRDSIQQAPAERNIQHYPWVEIAPDNPDLAAAAQHLARSAEWGLGSQASRWAQGRIQLALGDAGAAANVLSGVRDEAAGDPLLYADLLAALAYGGQMTEADQLQTSRQGTNTLTPQLREIMAYTHLLGSAQAGAPARAGAEAALAVRPEDLLANYVLWQAAESGGDTEQAAEYRTRLATIVALPESRPVWEHTLPAIVDLIGQGVWNEAKATAVMAHLAWRYQDTARAATVLAALEQELPDLATAAMYAGDLALRQGDVTAGLAAYERAFALAPQTAPVLRRLALAHEQAAHTGGADRAASLAEAAAWYAQLLAVQADDLSALARLAAICPALTGEQTPAACKTDTAAFDPVERWLQAAATYTPSVVLNQPLNALWTLEGFTVDEPALVRGEPADLFVFWRGPEGAVAGSAAAGWQQAGDRWLQFLPNAVSMLPDGGFELGLTQRGLPLGIATDIYAAPAETKRLEQDPLRASTVAVLQNSETYSLTSYISDFMAVAPDTIYLQSGWLSSDGGVGYFGRAWFMDYARLYNRVDTYVQIGVTGEQWQQYAAVAQPEPNAVEFQTWLLNYFSDGALRQDDTWLAPIGIPGQSAGERN